MGLGYDVWLEALDREVYRMFEVSLSDLPDMPTREWYDDGYAVSVARGLLVGQLDSAGYEFE